LKEKDWLFTVTLYGYLKQAFDGQTILYVEQFSQLYTGRDSRHVFAWEICRL